MRSIPRRPGPVRRRLVAALLLAGASVGCLSAEQHRAQADAEVYAILEERRAELALGEKNLSIEPPQDSLRQRLLKGEAIGPVGIVEVLQIAAENSRDYRSRKEDLYLAALDLTLERFRFQVQRNGSMTGFLNGDGDGANTATGGATVGFTKLLESGASIVADMGLTMARTISTGDSWDLIGAPFVNITQPLMRGFGARIVREPLTQGERNVVYEVRDFERFRRSFAIDVISRYFQLLRTADQVKNERDNKERLGLLRERNEAHAKAGRLSDIQADQARQDELSSANTLISALERYGTALDDFKLFLGLPIDVPLELDTSVLTNLEIDETLTVDEQVAIDAALRLRMDYMTALDRQVDAERKLYIAADNLRTRLDVGMSGSATSELDEPFKYSKDDLSWQLRASIDLPIDIIGERNAYREAIITVERARRAAEQLADEIRADLRASLRQAATRKQSVEIQAGAVQLNERRVESAALSLQAGRADTRDILEAQRALVAARNNLTTARVDYYLSQLALWRDMELLRVEEQGLRFAREGLEPPPTEDTP